MTTYHFREVRLSTARRGKCADCGKKTSRTVKVMQTLNPFNRNASGEPKTQMEIHGELTAELREKAARPLLCSACENGAGA